MLQHKLTSNSFETGRYLIITSPWPRVLAGVLIAPTLLMAFHSVEKHGRGKVVGLIGRTIQISLLTALGHLKERLCDYILTKCISIYNQDQVGTWGNLDSVFSQPQRSALTTTPAMEGTSITPGPGAF